MLENLKACEKQETLVESLQSFVDGVMSNPSLLTTPMISVFDIGRHLEWTASEAETEVLGALAVEVAVAEGRDVSGEKRDWIAETFSMQSILRQVFLTQKKWKDEYEHLSAKKKTIQKYLARSQKTLEVRKARTEKALKQKCFCEADDVERDMQLSKRNVQNRKLKGVKKPRKVRATDKVCEEEAPGSVSCVTLIHI